jgi:coenzyme F420 hydrogenase subunit beta
MKTFADLVKEVQEPGLCHHCGGCFTFCTAINYGALAMDQDGKPLYRDRDNMRKKPANTSLGAPPWAG